MCETCVELDKKIAHYERLASSILDQRTVGGINELNEEMKAEKAALHPDAVPSRPPSTLVFRRRPEGFKVVAGRFGDDLHREVLRDTGRAMRAMQLFSCAYRLVHTVVADGTWPDGV